MRSVRVQFDFLSRFAEQVASGVQRIDGTFRRRAELYGESARGAYEETRRTGKQEQGLTQERRVLGDADHCLSCESYAAAGWVDIGTLPAIGQESECMSRCRCHMEYR